ncbi:unnamed protein product [Discosporangium mesarthrocarpum]
MTRQQAIGRNHLSRRWGVAVSAVCTALAMRMTVGFVPSGFITHKGFKMHQSVSRRGKCLMAGEGPQGNFFRMGGVEDTPGFGPRCVLVGGVSPDILDTARVLLNEQGVGGDGEVPVVGFTSDLSRRKLEEVLREAPEISRKQQEEEIMHFEGLKSPVVLVSGLGNMELRVFVSRFRQETGLRAGFAKAVPNAMKKALGQLCGEIADDHADALSGKLHRPGPGGGTPD